MSCCEVAVTALTHWWRRLKCLYAMQVQQTLGYVTAAYSVMLGMTVIVFELVCFDGAVKCELLDMSKTGRSM